MLSNCERARRVVIWFLSGGRLMRMKRLFDDDNNENMMHAHYIVKWLDLSPNKERGNWETGLNRVELTEKFVVGIEHHEIRLQY